MCHWGWMQRSPAWAHYLPITRLSSVNIIIWFNRQAKTATQVKRTVPWLDHGNSLADASIVLVIDEYWWGSTNWSYAFRYVAKCHRKTRLYKGFHTLEIQLWVRTWVVRTWNRDPCSVHNGLVSDSRPGWNQYAAEYRAIIAGRPRQGPVLRYKKRTNAPQCKIKVGFSIQWPTS